MDAVFRRYMDIIHKYALGQEPPARKPLWMPGDPEEPPADPQQEEEDGPPKKKQKQMPTPAEKKGTKNTNPNLTAMQAHLFHLLRPLVSQHHNVRDALARSRTGDIDAFENVLALTEAAVKQGISAYEAEQANGTSTTDPTPAPEVLENLDPYESSLATVARCKRPWWVCQPYVRPLPKEAIEKGSMSLSKKEKRRLEIEAEEKKQTEETKKAGLEPEGRVQIESVKNVEAKDIESLEENERKGGKSEEVVEEPKEGVVCG
jgi:tRNA-dihydrouridine synthase 1